MPKRHVTAETAKTYSIDYLVEAIQDNLSGSQIPASGGTTITLAAQELRQRAQNLWEAVQELGNQRDGLLGQVRTLQRITEAQMVEVSPPPKVAEVIQKAREALDRRNYKGYFPKEAWETVIACLGDFVAVSTSAESEEPAKLKSQVGDLEDYKAGMELEAGHLQAELDTVRRDLTRALNVNQENLDTIQELTSMVRRGEHGDIYPVDDIEA